MWRPERHHSAEEVPARPLSAATASAANLATSLTASTLTKWPRPASGKPRPASSPASRSHRLPPSSSTAPLQRWSQQGARPISPQRRLVGPQPFAHDPRRFAAAPKPQGSSVRLERVLGRPSSAWAISSLHPVPDLRHGTRPASALPAREVSHRHIGYESKSSYRRSATLTHAAAARPEPGHLVCNHPDPWCRETPDGPAAHMWLAAAAMPAAAAEAADSPGRQQQPTPASTPASSHYGVASYGVASSHRRALFALNRARPASSPAQRRTSPPPAASLPEAMPEAMREAMPEAMPSLATAEADAAADAACALDEDGGAAKGVVFGPPPCSPTKRRSRGPCPASPSPSPSPLTAHRSPLTFHLHPRLSFDPDPTLTLSPIRIWRQSPTHLPRTSHAPPTHHPRISHAPPTHLPPSSGRVPSAPPRPRPPRAWRRAACCGGSMAHCVPGRRRN